MTNTPATPIQMGKIFWGLLLVLLGTLFLLDNFNVVTLDLEKVWKLWPLLIIASGVSMLSIKGWAGAVLTGTISIAILALIALVSLGVIKPETAIRTTSQTIAIGKQDTKTNNATVTIHNGAGQLDLRTHTAGPLVSARLESSSSELKHTASTGDNSQNVDLAVRQSKWLQGTYKNDLYVDLSENTPLNLKINAGASKVFGDLSALQLQRLDIDAGASDIDLTLGNKAAITNVVIDAGVSSITLRVPKAAGIQVSVTAGLSHTNLPGLKEVSKGRYESQNYTISTSKINIHGDIGMASFNVEQY